MITIEDSFNNEFKEGTVIALGSFDGLHLGHMSLIKEAIKLAKDNKLKSMVFSFKNHPLSIINEEMVPKLLMDNSYKLEILQSTGVDIVNLVNFDNNFMMLSPENFIKNIVNCYKVSHIVTGFNYRFGYKNLGDLELLHKLSSKYNFNVHVIDAVKLKGEVISSSHIRNLISEGEILKANKMLGRAYMLHGKVAKGKQIGRQIGFPTINLDYNKSFQIPFGGVYYTVSEYNKNIYKGITNIGYNPTVEGKKLCIETYLLNFDQEIYGKEVRVFFKKRFRDEKKFNSLGELMDQLKKDKRYAEKQTL